MTVLVLTALRLDVLLNVSYQLCEDWTDSTATIPRPFSTSL